MRSLRIAGDETDEAIIQYARSAYNLLIGERTAESIKIAVGSAFPQPEEQMTAVRGRDLVSGLPRAVRMTSTEIREAIAEPIAGIVEVVKMTLERTPPELAADIVDRGICYGRRRVAAPRPRPDARGGDRDAGHAHR